MPDNRILVTGATGFIGRALVAELLIRGYDAHCAVRTISNTVDLPGTLIEVGEVGASTDWAAALLGIDVIIHLVARAHVINETAADPAAEFNAVNFYGTRRLAEVAAEQGVKRLVYVSSIGVNGDYATSQDPFTEKTIAAPHNAYSTSKQRAEQALLEVAAETGLEVVILRPPLVYGPGNPGNFLRLLKLVDKGLPLPLASVSNQRSMIYLGNLVDALIAVAVKSEAAGQLYLVSDKETVSTPYLLDELAKLMGKRNWMWPLPVSWLRVIGKILGKSSEVDRLIGSLVVDSAKITSDLQWSPPFSMHQGLKETVRWFQRELGI